MAGYNDSPHYEPGGVRLNAGRLWASGIATAVVAALVTVVGMLIARGLFKVAVLAPHQDGVWGSARTATYAIIAAAVAVLATALMHLLSVTVAEPRRFFRWIMLLATVIAVVLPLTLADAWGSRIATGLINLAIGAVITGIIDSVAGVVGPPPAAFDPVRERIWEQPPPTRPYREG
jgi:hypothetical protein